MGGTSLSSEAISYISVSICVFSIIISLVATWIIYVWRKFDRVGTIHMIGMSLSSTIMSIAYLLEILCQGQAGDARRFILFLVDNLQYLLPFLGAFQMTLYLISCIEEVSGELSLKMIIYAVYSLVLIVAICELAIGNFFYLDSMNNYHRGPHYMLSQIIGFILAYLNVHLIIFSGKELGKRRRVILFLYLFFPLLALILQNLIFGVYMLPFSMALSMLIMFVMLQTTQMEAFYNNEKELSDVKISLILSQLRPHFMYNALSSISVLCKKNPDEAARMMDCFSEFLRKNMNDMKSNRETPISKEIHHIQNYIRIEQMRFGDDLKVEYDLQDLDFEIPSLVIQPLVENAIQHGVCAREDVGTIRIATRKANNSHILTVTDDGIGYDVKSIQNDGKLHLGINSARERLRRYHRSELLISSIPGKGTTATIIIHER